MLLCFFPRLSRCNGSILLLFVLACVNLNNAYAQSGKDVLEKGWKLYADGKYDSAAAVLERASQLTLGRDKMQSFVDAAMARALSNNDSLAINNLDSAVEQGMSSEWIITKSVELQSIRSHPKYQALSKKFFQRMNEKQEFWYWGAYFGFLFVLFFYNLFLAVILRSRTYLYYTLTVFAFAQFEANGNRLFQVFSIDIFFWLRHLSWIPNSFVLFGSLTAMLFLIFTREFLQLRDRARKMNRAVLITISFLVLLSVSSFFSFPLRTAAMIAWMFSYGIAIAAAVWSWKNHYKPARFFVAGCFFLTLGVIVISLESMHVLNSNLHLFVFKAYHLGGILFFLSLALALGDQINILKREKETAQEKALIVLEEKVRERTREVVEQKKVIEEKNKEVMDSIKYASRIQRALITSETYIQRQLNKLIKR